MCSCLMPFVLIFNCNFFGDPQRQRRLQETVSHPNRGLELTCVDMTLGAWMRHLDQSKPCSLQLHQRLAAMMATGATMPLVPDAQEGLF